MKWKILKRNKDTYLSLKELEGTLMINIKHIPSGYSLEEYIEYIKKNNIVLVY